MDASQTEKRLAGKTALIIKKFRALGTASVLAIVKKITVLQLRLAFGKSAFTTRQAHIIDGVVQTDKPNKEEFKLYSDIQKSG